jgi:hypothetical protein
MAVFQVYAAVRRRQEQGGNCGGRADHGSNGSHLERDGEHQCASAVGADRVVTHDTENVVAWAAGAKSVGDIGEAIEMHRASEQLRPLRHRQMWPYR